MYNDSGQSRGKLAAFKMQRMQLKAQYQGGYLEIKQRLTSSVVSFPQFIDKFSQIQEAHLMKIFSFDFNFQNLIKHLPDQEQLNSLSQFKNDYNNLCEPEQFAVVVSTVSQCLPSLEGIFVLCENREKKMSSLFTPSSFTNLQCPFCFFFFLT